jgi:tetratricopeptide (TPR) repeat protein
VFVCLCLSLALLNAEVHLRGTISETSDAPNDLVLELRSASGQSTETPSTSPSLNGNFEFSNVKPGHYVLAVKNRQGETLKEEYFWANGSHTELNIRMREDKTEQVHGAGHGTVSVRRLNHKVPKPAVKAMQRYRKCKDRKDDECAAAALDEAIGADAEYLEAYVNRSALRAKVGAWEGAVADTDAALKIDPDCSLAHANRAFVAVHRKEYRQAIESANAALRTEPGNVSALYFRALAEVNLGNHDKGFAELERLAADFEPARETLTQAAPQRARLAALKARQSVGKSSFTKAE